MVRRHGFSLHQIAFGHDPHLAGDMLSDTEEVTGKSAALASIPFGRLVQIRLGVRKAFLEAADSKAYREAIDAHPRV